MGVIIRCSAALALKLEAADVERLQDLALMIHHACRADTSIKFDALRTPAYRILARAMTALHDASFQTVIIRSGFGLGLLKQAR